jgi:hypothetical protein
MFGKAKKFICASCGENGVPKHKKTGSFGVTLILLFFMVIPGVIYEMMVRKRIAICHKCGSQDLVPEDSRRGRMLQKQFDDAI